MRFDKVRFIALVALPILILEVAADTITLPKLTGREHGDFYPAASLRQGEQGDTVIDLGIDITGRVADCRVAGSSGFPALDAQSCAVARRWWTFTPALQSGRAVFGTISETVKWRLNKAITVEAASKWHLILVGVPFSTGIGPPGKRSERALKVPGSNSKATVYAVRAMPSSGIRMRPMPR